MPFAKGDVRVVGQVRAECKTTAAQSYALKLNEWRKIQSEAIAGGGEMPVMQIEFQGTFGLHTKLAVISWEDLVELIQDRKDMNNPKLFQRTPGWDR
jgi:hypothetical protein